MANLEPGLLSANRITINKASAPAELTQALVSGAPSFVQRLIETTVTLTSSPSTNQPGAFAESGGNTVTLSGARTKVRILTSGSPAGSHASVDVYGLTPSLMAQLSTLGMVVNIIPRNKIAIAAGDAQSGLATIYSGIIFAAYGDYEAAPDVPFHFECNSGLGDLVAPAAASSYPQATDVATILSGLANQIGLGFENSGVSVTLPPSYFPGTIWQQIKAIGRAANINTDRVMGPSGEMLAIWPKGGARTTANVPLISAATGMIGYPAFTQQGIVVRTLFNPQITRGTQVRVESSVPGLSQLNSSGQWAVSSVSLALDSLVPRGQWMMTLNCYNSKYAKPMLKPAT